MQPHELQANRGLPRSIGVIGGGTAGYFTALAIKQRFPQIDVTVVESSAVPIIGVGEATTTLMPAFLHAVLGLDIIELYRTVKPTFKLGIKFEWGLPGDYYFTYPFGDADPVAAFAYDRDLRSQSLTSLLMANGGAPIVRGPDGELLSLLPSVKFAYHLDNSPFVGFLTNAARRSKIGHIDTTIADVVLHADGHGVSALRAADGSEFSFDFYVDATGFRSLLLGHALASPFESYASSLFCDRAIVATVPQKGTIEPYTTAETMDAGWCWRIPVVGEDHRGYVHSSAFIDEDTAVAEMIAKNPGMSDPRVIRFRSGRHRDFWLGNMVAVGNAYGFVEPLESTALHMVIVEIAYLIAGLEAMADSEGGEKFRTFANEAIGAHWDYLRWFLAVHYKYNGRLDTPFWRSARADTNISGIQNTVDRFQQEGPVLDVYGQEFNFWFPGLIMLLLGQQVDIPVRDHTAISKEAWEERKQKHQRVVDRALPQDEALRVLLDNPQMLTGFAKSPSSWCRRSSERVVVVTSPL